MRDQESSLQLDPDTLLLFLDETGDERRWDPNYPVFGIGGCAVMGSEYERYLRTPWRNFKRTHFGNPRYPFHACDENSLTHSQMSGLGYFFRTKKFHCFAAVSRKSTRIDVDVTNYALVYLMTLKRMEAVGALYPRFKSITMIFEASERTEELMESHFGNFSFTINGESIPVELYKMNKSEGEPGLEVADATIHTAGCQVRNSQAGKMSRRKDFEAVFNSQGEDGLRLFMNIEHFGSTPIVT